MLNISLKFLMILGMVSVCFVVNEAGAEKAEINIKKGFTLGASMMRSVMIDVESNLNIEFVEVGVDSVTVAPAGGNSVAAQPAVVRISGDPTEMMVHVEADSLSNFLEQNQNKVTISQFNVLEGDAGDTVNVLPFSDEKSFILTIGGTITRQGNNDDYYTGSNILSINYL